MHCIVNRVILDTVELILFVLYFVVANAIDHSITAPFKAHFLSNLKAILYWTGQNVNSVNGAKNYLCTYDKMLDDGI